MILNKLIVTVLQTLKACIPDLFLAVSSFSHDLDLFDIRLDWSPPRTNHTMQRGRPCLDKSKTNKKRPVISMLLHTYKNIQRTRPYFGQSGFVIVTKLSMKLNTAIWTQQRQLWKILRQNLNLNGLCTERLWFSTEHDIINSNKTQSYLCINMPFTFHAQLI